MLMIKVLHYAKILHPKPLTKTLNPTYPHPEVVQDGRRTSESCAMLWPMLCESSTETEAARREGFAKQCRALGVWGLGLGLRV